MKNSTAEQKFNFWFKKKLAEHVDPPHSPTISHHSFGNWKADVFSSKLLNPGFVNSFCFYFSTFSKTLLKKKLIFHGKKSISPSCLFVVRWFLCILWGPYLTLLASIARRCSAQENGADLSAPFSLSEFMHWQEFLSPSPAWSPSCCHLYSSK